MQVLSLSQMDSKGNTYLTYLQFRRAAAGALSLSSFLRVREPKPLETVLQRNNGELLRRTATAYCHGTW